MRHRHFIIGATVATLAVAGHVPTPAPAQDPDASVLYLDVNRPITTAAPDGAGGWFVGGSFTEIAGQRRLRLAHVTASGQLDPIWKPVVKGRGRYPHARSSSPPSVSALSVVGDTVYVGGWFASINDRPRRYLAAVDARTGRLLRWNPRPNWPVQALATDARTLYAGGLFTRIGRAQRRRLAAFDATTGALTAWNPRVTGSVRATFEPEVTALLFARGRVYVGGLFTVIGRRQRTGVAAIDAATGAPTRWRTRTGNVYALAIAGDALYAGGFFGQVWRSVDDAEVGERSSLAAFDADNGGLLPWRADVDNGVVNALTVVGDRLYVGGAFDELAGAPAKTLGVVSTITGAPIPWQPRVSRDDHYALVAAGDRVLVGGEFQMARRPASAER